MLVSLSSRFFKPQFVELSLSLSYFSLLSWSPGDSNLSNLSCPPLYPLPCFDLLGFFYSSFGSVTHKLSLYVKSRIWGHTLLGAVMGFLLGALFLILAGFLRPSESLRPLKERASAAGSWSDEVSILVLAILTLFVKLENF